jgi:hypothetical protein
MLNQEGYQFVAVHQRDGRGIQAGGFGSGTRAEAGGRHDQAAIVDP